MNSDIVFKRMDELCEARTPFFFIVDFLSKTPEVYTQEELSNADIIIDFPTFKYGCEKASVPSDKTFQWETFPEPISDYKEGFDIVMKALKSERISLLNYTQPTKIKTNYSLKEIFALSGAKYKIYFKDKFVCFSPETFIISHGDTLVTYPMKGTIDASIDNAKNILLNNPKEIEEHKTAILLLEQDLEKVADDVELIEFRKVDHIIARQRELFTTSSIIEGKIKENFKNKLGSLLKEVLPGGSILGLPKAEALEITMESERYDRGYYSGICGYFNGIDFDSCVLIRYLEKDGEQFTYKSGGGITEKSILNNEYQEMINKVYVPIS